MARAEEFEGKFRWSAFAVRLAVALAIFTLLLVFVEVGSYLKLRYRPTKRVSESVKTDVFKGASWTAQYFADFNASSPVRYHSYTLWRRAPYAGKTINIDFQGLRVTANIRCEAGVPSVWMFGNSALWGSGTPDWATIPSLLAQDFTASGQWICIKNFGEKAWVSTQEVIALMLELKHEPEPPAVVVFYDGPTDSYLPYESAEPDVHDNFEPMRQKFEDTTSSSPGFQFLKKTNTYVFLNQTLRNLGMQDPLQPQRRTSPEQASAMAKTTVDNYLKNLEVVDALASHYGFQALYFWQPTVRAGKKPLTANEDEMRRGEEALQPGSEIVFRATYDSIAHLHRNHLIDLSDMFDDHPEPLFVETNHLGPEGNALVAQRMFQTILDSGALPNLGIGKPRTSATTQSPAKPAEPLSR